jgi:hypothetical protein
MRHTEPLCPDERSVGVPAWSRRFGCVKCRPMTLAVRK